LWHVPHVQLASSVMDHLPLSFVILVSTQPLEPLSVLTVKQVMLVWMCLLLQLRVTVAPTVVQANPTAILVLRVTIVAMDKLLSHVILVNTH
jgi:hypothetical protein